MSTPFKLLGVHYYPGTRAGKNTRHIFNYDLYFSRLDLNVNKFHVSFLNTPQVLEHREVETSLKDMREQLKELTKAYDKSENDLKALQSVGQIVGQRFLHLSSTLIQLQFFPMFN